MVGGRVSDDDYGLDRKVSRNTQVIVNWCLEISKGKYGIFHRTIHVNGGETKKVNYTELFERYIVMYLLKEYNKIKFKYMLFTYLVFLLTYHPGFNLLMRLLNIYPNQFRDPINRCPYPYVLIKDSPLDLKQEEGKK